MHARHAATWQTGWPSWQVVLRALREAHGSTQDGWAARLGYSSRTVQRWERGLAVPDAAAEAALLALCGELNLWRRYEHGPLQGLTVTAAGLQALLANARLTPSGPAPPQHAAVTPLPTALTAFVGREQELAAIAALVKDGRLVTLTGPGGSGKTRLAIETARRLVSAFPDGVVFVDLAPLADPALVPAAVAQALAVQQQPAVPLRETLRFALRDKRLLLVLDNYEHLLEAAEFVAFLLQTGDTLALLVTSRAPLRVPGEQEYPLPPLPLPLLAAPASVLADNPAVRLFAARAQAVRPSFRLSEQSTPVVAAICARLDGLPLAIELAAARIRVLPPAALLSRLSERLPLLTGGLRTAPARQQTLRATLAWSYDLLAPAEQCLFRRLALFTSGCTVAGAAAMSVDFLAAEEVLDRVEALLDQSLLSRSDDTLTEPRFGMLETLREFARAQLTASGERALACTLHARYVLALVEGLVPALRSAQPELATAQLEAEAAEVRTVLAWAVTAGTMDTAAATLGLRLFCALYTWYYDAAPAEGARWGAALVGLAGTRQRTALRAEALYATASLGSRWLGSSAESFSTNAPLLAESISLYRALADKRGLGLALTALGAYPQPGDRGRELQEEGVALLREAGDADALAEGLLLLGIAAGSVREDHSRSLEALEEALLLRRRLGRPVLVAWALLHLGVEELRRHNVAAAVQYLEEGAARLRALGGGWRLVRALNSLGQALCYVEEPRAVAVFREALALGHKHGPPHDVYYSLEGLALLAARRGLLASAARLWGAVAVWPQKTTVRLVHVDYDDTIAAARAALGEAAFAAAWTAGNGLTLEQALDEAIALTDLLAPA